jgi:hypothetical protein
MPVPTSQKVFSAARWPMRLGNEYMAMRCQVTLSSSIQGKTDFLNRQCEQDPLSDSFVHFFLLNTFLDSSTQHHFLCSEPVSLFFL